MTTPKFICILLFVVVAGLILPACKPRVSEYGAAGDYEFSLPVGDLDRRILVHVPETYHRDRPHALVVALHGGGGNAEGSIDYFGLNGLSDQEGFIAAYPEGTGRKVFGKLFGSWNAGRCCPPAMDNDVDDVGYLEAMIDLLGRHFNIDPDRIYMLGMSNGAQMSFRAACEIADRIAAIATSGSIGSYEPCLPSRAIPVLHIQGRVDPCSPYQGGQCGGCMADLLARIGFNVEKRLWACDAVPDYLYRWSILNNCEGEPQRTYENKGTICISYDRCENGSEVVLCTVEGMGHTWAGRSTYSADACVHNPDGYVCSVWMDVVGPLGEDFPANEIIWAFFENHPQE